MVQVLKANGQQEGFSEAKLHSSIHRAGIPKTMEEQVIAHITPLLYNNIPTSEIYQHIMEFLKASPHHKAKYSLKKSIMDLGPTGFPFEKFVARILEHEGYSTQTNVIAIGNCVSHEIDVVAKNPTDVYMVEAKFHNKTGIKTDVHVSLYTKARFEDTKARNAFTKCLLVTNTKATSDAITYAQCVGMDVMSWEYPNGRSLRDVIEKYQLHLITALDSLSQNQKQNLLEHNVLLCKDLLDNADEVLFDMPEEKKKEILQEAQNTCSV